MQCSICGKAIAPVFPMHLCAVTPEMQGWESYDVWADPKAEEEMEDRKGFKFLDEAVKYARSLMSKHSDSCITVFGYGDDDEDGSCSISLSEINMESTPNMQSTLIK